jgi:hypothetical protein
LNGLEAATRCRDVGLVELRVSVRFVERT